jgi:hypothetical protein
MLAITSLVASKLRELLATVIVIRVALELHCCEPRIIRRHRVSRLAAVSLQG